MRMLLRRRARSTSRRMLPDEGRRSWSWMPAFMAAVAASEWGEVAMARTAVGEWARDVGGERGEGGRVLRSGDMVWCGVVG